MRNFLFAMLIPLLGNAQTPSLSMVQSLTLGDAKTDYLHTVEFGFRPAVVVTNMDQGCSLVFNIGSPIETVVTTISEGKYLVKVRTAEDEGGGDLSPLLGGEFPLTLWTEVTNAKCHCTPGNYTSLSEFKRNK